MKSGDIVRVKSDAKEIFKKYGPSISWVSGMDPSVGNELVIVCDDHPKGYIQLHNGFWYVPEVLEYPIQQNSGYKYYSTKV